MNKIFDPVRNKTFLSTPEEKIRQKLLRHMIEHLGYPKSSIGVEVFINNLDHVKHANINRRADIICFSKNIHPNYSLYPLIIVECKAVKITNQVLAQVEGYNAIVQAYYFAVANDNEVYTGWLDAESKTTKKVNYLPSYKTLLETVHGTE